MNSIDHLIIIILALVLISAITGWIPFPKRNKGTTKPASLSHDSPQPKPSGGGNDGHDKPHDHPPHESGKGGCLIWILGLVILSLLLLISSLVWQSPNKKLPLGPTNQLYNMELIDSNGNSVVGTSFPGSKYFTEQFHLTVKGDAYFEGFYYLRSGVLDGPKCLFSQHKGAVGKWEGTHQKGEFQIFFDSNGYKPGEASTIRGRFKNSGSNEWWEMSFYPNGQPLR